MTTSEMWFMIRSSTDECRMPKEELRWRPAAYAKTAATTATARPPREMTLPAAAAVDCSAGLLWVAEEDGRLVPVAPVEPTLGATAEVALTPGTMGVVGATGAGGTAVGPDGTAETEETAGTEGADEATGTEAVGVAGGAWIWPSLI